ncbi:MAG TPA: efflux RND transporter permease subunit, partial [Anaeromyxobacteraceae bacterium]
REVQGPVIGIALILAAVFVPVAFMSGITGRLYQQFALTIAISVLISAFNALTLSPALSAMLLRPRKHHRGLVGKLGGGFNRWFERVTHSYVGINARLVRKVAIPLVLLAGVAGLSTFIGGRLPTGFVPQEDNGYAVIAMQLPDAASLQRTRAAFDKVEKALASTPGVKFYTTIAGYYSLSGASASYFGTAFVNFQPWDDRPGRDAAAIIKDINAKLSRIPDARAFAIAPSAIPGLSASGGLSIMLQDRSGGPVELLAKNVQRYLAEARKRPELQNVVPNFSPSVPQLYASVDREKAMKQGVPIGDVYAALQAFLGGSYVNDFTRFGRQWKVYVQADSEYRRGPDDLRSFYVRSASGAMMPLSSFVTVREATGPEYTVRFNLYRAAEVLASPAPGYSSGQALAAMEDVAKQLPPEMGYGWYGLSYQEKVAEGGTAKVLGLSLVFVFLILAALYESWSLPFSVLLGTPIAVLGAYLGLLSRRFDNNVYAQIGLVMLVGLTAKNAILIVEFAKAELEKGRPLVKAALTGARLRLRPILMTSFAFIFGCLPLWVAEGAGAASRQVMGTVVVAGMLAATLFGIFTIPSLFVFVESLARRGRPPVALHPPVDGQSPGGDSVPSRAHGDRLP